MRDPGFQPLLSRIHGSSFHSGNRVAVFVQGEEAFAAMLSAVSTAKSEVLRSAAARSRGSPVPSARVPAILHAKTLVAGGLVSVIGSSNLDFRSFELNTECNFVIEDGQTAKRMEAAFLEDLTRSEEIRHEAWRRRHPLHRLGDSVARSLAPLL